MIYTKPPVIVQPQPNLREYNIGMSINAEMTFKMNMTFRRETFLQEHLESNLHIFLFHLYFSIQCSGTVLHLFHHCILHNKFKIRNI